MSTTAEPNIRLVQRRRSLTPMVGKVLAGLSGVAGGLAVMIDRPMSRGLPPVLAEMEILVVVLVLVGGVWIGQDGVTDLIARWALRALPRKAILLGPDGLHYSAMWADATAEISVRWAEVEGCAFRPGFGGNVFLCFDVPGRYPTPPAAHGCDPAVDPDVVRIRAYLWSMLVRPEPASVQERTMLIDTYVLGTPFAINLAICPGVDTTRLDRELRRWTDGRCFLPPAN